MNAFEEYTFWNETTHFHAFAFTFTFAFEVDRCIIFLLLKWIPIYLHLFIYKVNTGPVKYNFSTCTFNAQIILSYKANRMALNKRYSWKFLPMRLHLREKKGQFFLTYLHLAFSEKRINLPCKEIIAFIYQWASEFISNFFFARNNELIVVSKIMNSFGLLITFHRWNMRRFTVKTQIITEFRFFHNFHAF